MDRQEWNLPPEIIDRLDSLYTSYALDRFKIKRRVEKYISEYFDVIDASRSRKNLSGMEELLDRYSQESSEPPTLLRLSARPEELYRWEQKDIAVILNRNVSSVSRNLRDMEASPLWTERLNKLRMQVERGPAMKIFMYSEDIFDLFLDFCSRDYIAKRLIEPRHGSRVSAEVEVEIWRYWDWLNKNGAAADGKILSLAHADEGGELFFGPDDKAGDASEPVPEVRKSWRTVFGDFWREIKQKKTLTAVVTVFSQYIDISRRMSFLFFLLPVVLVPTTAFCLYKLRRSADEELRSHFVQISAFALLLTALWTLNFSGRLISGDITRSAIPATLESVSRKLNIIESKQDKAQEDLGKISEQTATISKELSQQKTDAVKRAKEAVSSTEKFVREATADSKAIADADFERQIRACEDSLSEIGSEQHELRAELLLEQSDVFTIWGCTVSNARLTKLDEAIKQSEKVLDDKNNISGALTGRAYSAIGTCYQLESDIREKNANLKKSLDYFRRAEPFAAQMTDVYDKVCLYNNLANTYAAISETFPQDESAAEGRYLAKAVDYFGKAAKAAASHPEAAEPAKAAMYGQASSSRKLSNISARTGHLSTARTECQRAIDAYERLLKNINLEREQASYVKLNHNLGTAYMQLYDICLKDRKFIGDGNSPEKNAANVKKLSGYILKSRKALLNADEFNKTGGYISEGNICYQLGKNYYRAGSLLGQDSLLASAVKYYDLALQKFPVSNSLLEHLSAASDKAVTICGIGMLKKSPDRLKEAIRLSEGCLEKYERSGYRDVNSQFYAVMAQAYAELAKYEDSAVNLQNAQQYLKLAVQQ